MVVIKFDSYNVGWAMYKEDGEERYLNCSLCGLPLEIPFFIIRNEKEGYCNKCTLRKELKGNVLNPDIVFDKIIKVEELPKNTM